MSLVRRKIASCQLNGTSTVFLEFDDVTERMIRLFVTGRAKRLIDISVEEPLRPITHNLNVEKDENGKSFDLSLDDIGYRESRDSPILPTISVAWHDPAKR